MIGRTQVSAISVRADVAKPRSPRSAALLLAHLDDTLCGCGSLFSGPQLSLSEGGSHFVLSDHWLGECISCYSKVDLTPFGFLILQKVISHNQFFRLCSDDAAAKAWFVQNRWTGGIRCPRSGCDSIQTDTGHNTMPYRCRKSKKLSCGQSLSVKIGTFMEASNRGNQDWLFALFLVATNLKSVSCVKLHRDLSVIQRTAWHMMHRIRKALSKGDGSLFVRPVEMDETYMGGKRRNMSNSKREQLSGRDPVGKVAVVGMRDRNTDHVSGEVVDSTDAGTLQGSVKRQVVSGTADLHGRGDRLHTNGIESFWATVKRAHKGTFQRLSPKHLDGYVDEFAKRHNILDLDTMEQMAFVAFGVGLSRLR